MKKTFKNYITVLFGSGFARSVALLNSVIIARALGLEEFGKFSIFYTVMILIWVFPQAFDTTFVRYARSAESGAKKMDFLKIAVFSKLFYFTMMLFLSYPLAYFLAVSLFKKTELHFILVIAIISGGFLTFLTTMASTFQERERFVGFAFLHSCYTVSVLIILGLFTILGFELSVSRIAFFYLILSALIGSVSLKKLFKMTGKIFPLNMEYFKTSFALSKWIFGITCIFYVFHRLDTLFLAHYVSFAEIGIYSVATRLVMTISLMTGSFSGVFLPKASKALESKSSFKIYLKESVLGICIINIFVILLAISTTFWINILYGKEYLLASSALRILLGGWFIYIVYLPFSFLFYTLNDSKTRFKLEFLKFSIGIIFLYYLIPAKGIIGAAVAISIALTFYSIISLYVLWQKIRFKFQKERVIVCEC